MTEPYNPRLKTIIMSVVDNQIAGRDENGNPCDSGFVKETFERLSSIYGKAEAKRQIAEVLIDGMYDAMKSQKPFDTEKYRHDLARLE